MSRHRHIIKILAACTFALAVWSCTQLTNGGMSRYQKVGDGKIANVGAREMVVNDRGDFLLVDISDLNSRQHQSLHKGDAVSLYGHTWPEGKNHETTAQIEEIVLADGSRIRVSD